MSLPTRRRAGFLEYGLIVALAVMVSIGAVVLFGGHHVQPALTDGTFTDRR